THSNAEYIRETFESLRFEVHIHYDLTNSEFEKELLKYQMMDHSSYGAFACCISSHGRYGNIITKDGLMPILKMTDFFSESACPTLKEKPKMFFVQCCQ
ncbi:hypothetical protein HELRODRAFT_134617, partial [Helobdella robusta]|uniref:Caspase family p20 domain-containing protein n=1 Tax=Helobdella robusta TaxID=6412 RepID=T1EI55_HELRO